MSYRHNDALDDVYTIRQKLNDFFGNTAIIDDLSLPAQANIEQWIEKTIRSCNVVLLMIGKNWLTSPDSGENSKLFNPSDAVLLEIAAAFKYKKRIIPCILPGGAIPAEGDLPDIIKDLVYINAAVIPAKSDETDWVGVLAQVIHSIETTLRFYKDKLFWLFVCVWPVVISITTFFCSLTVGKIADKFSIMVQPMRYAGIYYLATGVVWTGVYALNIAEEYTTGKRSIFFLPIQHFKFIFFGIQDFFEALFLGFPLNILFAWLTADIAALLVFKYLHYNFEIFFLIAYAYANYFLLNLVYPYAGGNFLRYKKLFPDKPVQKHKRFDESEFNKKMDALAAIDRRYKSEKEKTLKQAWLEKNAQAVSRGL